MAFQSLLVLLQAQHIVDALDEKQDKRLPSYQVANPVQQLAVKQVGLLPGIFE